MTSFSDLIYPILPVAQITVHNLLSLQRQGPAVVSSRIQNVTMKVALAFSNVIVEAKFRLKRELRVLHPRASVAAIVDRIIANVSLHANVSEKKSIKTVQLRKIFYQFNIEYVVRIRRIRRANPTRTAGKMPWLRVSFLLVAEHEAIRSLMNQFSCGTIYHVKHGRYQLENLFHYRSLQALCH